MPCPTFFSHRGKWYKGITYNGKVKNGQRAGMACCRQAWEGKGKAAMQVKSNQAVSISLTGYNTNVPTSTVAGGGEGRWGRTGTTMGSGEERSPQGNRRDPNREFAGRRSCRCRTSAP